MLDKGFKPAAVYDREFLVKSDEQFGVALEREGGLIYCKDTRIICGDIEESKFYVERLIKTLLWCVGGFKVYVSGNREVFEYIKECYATGGLRAFDAEFMSVVYEKPFEVVLVDKLPETKDNPKAIGRHLGGYRIGFDAGGSDMKVSAVVDGEVIF
ncbi:hypothetical protein FACS189492_2830 [Clostridia bacterium]|nr:hypothetical protein FACS189492_2830 [Clostridia bacterium]